MANEFVLAFGRMKECQALASVSVEVLLLVSEYTHPLCKACRYYIRPLPPHNDTFKKCSNEGCSVYVHGDNLASVYGCIPKYVDRCQVCLELVCAGCACILIRRAREEDYVPMNVSMCNLCYQLPAIEGMD